MKASVVSYALLVAVLLKVRPRMNTRIHTELLHVAIPIKSTVTYQREIALSNAFLIYMHMYS